MAKLQRVTGKIFGGEAPLDEIGQFGSAKAGTPLNTQDVSTIQALSAYSEGWGSGVVTYRNFPPIEEVTGVLKTISYQTCYLLQEGIPEYDIGTEYSNTSIVKSVDGPNLSFYISAKSNNIGNPLSDTTSWIKANVASSRNIGELVASIIPLTDAGLHLLDGALINGTGAYAEFVDYIADIYNSSQLGRGKVITLPTFTSNTQDGITIADARSNTTKLQAIFNGSNTYNQIGQWNTYWISIDYAQPTYINYYSIQADNNDSVEYPSAWTLQASNDGTTWITIDTQSSITFVSNERKNFYVNASTAYEQYKIVFSNGVEYQNQGELKQVSFNVSSQYRQGFIPEADWQQSVTDYGVCGKFVYDSVNNTVRLPKITGIVEGTTDLTALGDLVEAGLPNITGNLYNINTWSGTADGAFAVTDTANRDSSGSGNTTYRRFTLNASNSSSIYGNSTTVQPQTIKVLYYICVATSAKTDIEVDIDDIATDLNGKADVDLTNANNQAKVLMSKMGMPSGTYTDLVLGTAGANYTAPANGWVYLNKTATDAGQYVEIANITGGSMSQVSRSVYNTQGIATYTPVSKGDIFSVGYTAGGNTNAFKFIYAQGSESEAS